MRRTLFFALVAAAFASCAIPELTPATGPGTDYPCGVNGVRCSGHMCCPEHAVCGGDDPTCSAGECCYVGDGYGARRPEPQRPEK